MQTIDDLQTVEMVQIDEPKCNHHNKKTGKMCQIKAGLGTDHPGQGYCYIHEDDEPYYGHHLPLVKLLDPEIRPLVLEVMENDSQIFDMRFELATLKTRYAQEFGDMTIQNMVNMVRVISSSMKNLHEMEQGRHYFIHINALALVLESVGQIARQYLPEGTLNDFSKDLESAIKMTLPQTTQRSIVTTALVSPIEDEMKKEQ